MADEVLVRVPLRLQKQSEPAGASQDANLLHNGQLSEVLRSVNETCREYGREEVRRAVCRVCVPCCESSTPVCSLNHVLLRGGRSDSGTDVHTRKGLRPRRVILHVRRGLARPRARCRPRARGVPCPRHVPFRYIRPLPPPDPRLRPPPPGPSKFAELVADIAPSLHKLALDAPTARAPAVFAHRLQFAVRFAEFHQRRANGDGQGAALDVVAMFRDEIAPRSWWAVILCDAVQLLQCST